VICNYGGTALNRYCTSCGKPLAPDSVACTNCGQNIETPNNFSAIKNWLNSLSGWYRLFFVYACTHLIIVVVTSTRTTSSLGGGPTHRSWDPSLEKIFLHGILPIGGVFLLGLAIRWAIKGFGENQPLAKVKVKQDTFEANRKGADKKKEETSKTNIKKVCRPKKINILFLWVFIAACIIIPIFILRISEKPRLSVDLKEFASKPKTPNTDSEWITMSDYVIKMSQCFSVMEIAEVLKEKYPENKNYQDAYKWLQTADENNHIKSGIHPLRIIPTVKSGDSYVPNPERNVGIYRIEKARSLLNKDQLATLLSLCCLNNNIECRVINEKIIFEPKDPNDFNDFRFEVDK